MYMSPDGNFKVSGRTPASGHGLRRLLPRSSGSGIDADLVSDVLSVVAVKCLRFADLLACSFDSSFPAAMCVVFRTQN